MPKRKAYPLRIHEDILAAMQRWADDELRSVNAQIEFVLRDALQRAGRIQVQGKVVIQVRSDDPTLTGTATGQPLADTADAADPAVDEAPAPPPASVRGSNRGGAAGSEEGEGK